MVNPLYRIRGDSAVLQETLFLAKYGDCGELEIDTARAGRSASGRSALTSSNRYCAELTLKILAIEAVFEGRDDSRFS
jgi:hypothetical protein